MKNILYLLLLLYLSFPMYGQKIPVMQKKIVGNEHRIDVYSATQNKADVLNVSQIAEDIEFVSEIAREYVSKEATFCPALDIVLTMKEMTKEGKTVFYSTHILDVAEKLCDRVAIIKGGKLVKSGSMKEIKGDKSLEKVFMELEK